MATMADTGLSIDGFTPGPLIVEQARAAEAAGARTLWLANHLFLRDPITLAAKALDATQDLNVGLMALSPYSMHPVQAAMAAATLAEFHPGRVLLSLGVGMPTELVASHIETPNPTRTLRESIELCRALLSGETVNYAGETFRVSQRRLENGDPAIPIVLAASGPRMLEMAGAVADGIMISATSSIPFVHWCLDLVRRGANGREVKTYGAIYTRLDANEAEVLNALRRTLGFILRGPHHARNVDLAGLDLDQEALRAAYSAEDWDRVDQLMTDEVVRRHAACGREADVRDRLAEYRATGLDEIIIAGVTDPDQIRQVVPLAT